MANMKLSEIYFIKLQTFILFVLKVIYTLTCSGLDVAN